MAQVLVKKMRKGKVQGEQRERVIAVVRTATGPALVKVKAAQVAVLYSCCSLVCCINLHNGRRWIQGVSVCVLRCGFLCLVSWSYLSFIVPYAV